MRIGDTRFSPGDAFLLFDELPFDWEAELPIVLSDKVELSETPFELLDSLEEGQAGFLLPGYHLPGGVNHCCLRIPRMREWRTFGLARDAFFESLTLLRLVSPVPYRVEGQFSVDDDCRVSGTFALYHVTAPSVSHPALRLSSCQVAACLRLQPIVNHWRELSLARITTALTYFGQVSNGLVWSRQMATMGLFAALEALFDPEGNGDKADLLARRVASYLEDVPTTCQVDASALHRFTTKAYRQVRSKEIHGGVASLIGEASTDPAAERAVVFCNLHEMVRLSLIKTAACPQDEILATYRSKAAFRDRIQEHCGLRGGKLSAAPMHFVSLT